MTRPNPTRSRLTAAAAALAVSLLSLAALPGAAAAAVIQVDADLDDGLVPAGFTLSTTGTSGLANSRLEASAINGSAVLRYGALPANLSRVDISYRAHFGDSFWGTYTRVELAGLPGLFHGFAEFNHGASNYAEIGSASASVTSPQNFSDFAYDITIVDGRIDFTGTDTATGTEEFSLVYADAGILLSNLTEIGLRAHNTTGNEPVWLDDISLRLETAAAVPAPAAAALFALGLAGLGYARRRRAA